MIIKTIPKGHTIMTTITLAKIGTNQTVNYAVDELAHYLKKIDRRLLIDQRTYDEYDAGITNVVWVGITSFVEANKLDDEILIDIKDGAGVITGANERAVLIAVYRFLRELGCRWIRPGDDGEVIPEKTLDKTSLTAFVRETPAIRHRCICIEGADSVEHIMNMLKWIPRNGMNTYYLQILPPMPFFNRWYAHTHNPLREPEEFGLPELNASIARLDEEIAKRGLLYHAGGHGWHWKALGFEFRVNDPESPLLTPEIKEMFAMIDGERKLDSRGMGFTQLCYSNPKVRERMADAVVDYCKAHPNVNYLHFCLADGFNNQCECEECVKMRPADHYVKILNDIDERLTKEEIDTKLTFGAYCDLLWEPRVEKIKNPDRFILDLSPISRVYTNSYLDINTEYNEPLPEYVRNKVTLPRSFEANFAFLNKWRENTDFDSYVFEYNMMWDHYLDPGYMNCARILHIDVTNIKAKLNMNGWISCQENRAAFPTGLPVYAMARGLWDANSKFEDICDEYFTAAFGELAADVQAYLWKLTELFDPQFMRNDHIEALPTAYERAEKIIALTHEFESSHITPNKDVNASWFYLSYHAEYCRLYAEVIKRYAKNDIEGIKEWSEKYNLFIFGNEPVLHTVHDPSLFSEIFPRWLKRAFSTVVDTTVDF